MQVPSSKGYLPKYKRVFKGFSTRWQGAPASVEKQNFFDESGCRGVIAWLSEQEIKRLDKFEGCESTDCGNENPDTNDYRREKVQVTSWVVPEEGGEKRRLMLDAWVYIKNRGDSGPPSKSYVNAIVKNIEEYWKDEVEEELAGVQTNERVVQEVIDEDETSEPVLATADA
jgi:hypothetical protein